MGGDIKKQCDTCQHCLIGYVGRGSDGRKCAVEAAICLGEQRFGSFEYNLWRPREEPDEPQEKEGGMRFRYDDPISPNHYTRLDPEPIRVTMAWGLDHYRACALKYIARAEFHEKGAKVNIEKAIRYLRYYLENLENQEKKNDM